MAWIALTDLEDNSILVNMDNILQALPYEDGTRLVTTVVEGESAKRLTVKEPLSEIQRKLTINGAYKNT
jgi:hypothetical protein